MASGGRVSPHSAPAVSSPRGSAVSSPRDSAEVAALRDHESPSPDTEEGAPSKTKGNAEEPTPKAAPSAAPVPPHDYAELCHEGRGRKRPAAAAVLKPDDKRARETNALNASPNNPQLPASFEEMGLRDDVLRGIYAAGFERPSRIQRTGIPAVASGRDVVAQAQSGTGKTATFAIGALQRVDVSVRETQVLVLAPTRELATQTAAVFAALGDYARVQAHACIGGTKVGDDARRLEHGAHVVVGTPGRVYDMLRRESLRMARVRTLVLDEADEMLGRGFRDQIFDIYRHVPPGAQIVLVSATLPKDVVAIADAIMADPVRITVRAAALTLDGIRQHRVSVGRDEWRFDTLCDLYDAIAIAQAVVFCASRARVEWLAGRLRAAHFAVAAMHGEMPQAERDAVMAEFRRGAARVLVATDVWARGIDVQQVSVVFNYDVPPSPEAYLHRIGRSGRFGRRGLAITLVADEDEDALAAIERHFSTAITPLPARLDNLI